MSSSGRLTTDDNDDISVTVSLRKALIYTIKAISKCTCYALCAVVCTIVFLRGIVLFICYSVKGLIFFFFFRIFVHNINSSLVNSFKSIPPGVGLNMQ